MKRFLLIIIILLIVFLFGLPKCENSHDPNEQKSYINICDYINYYLLHKPIDNLIYDYRCFYDIDFFEEQKEAISTFRSYIFTTSTPLVDEAPKLYINTDLDDNIFYVELLIKSPSLNLFDTTDDIVDYLTVLLHGLIPASEYKYLNKCICQLYQNAKNTEFATTIVKGWEIYLDISNDNLFFSIFKNY